MRQQSASSAAVRQRKGCFRKLSRFGPRGRGVATPETPSGSAPAAIQCLSKQDQALFSAKANTHRTIGANQGTSGCPSGRTVIDKEKRKKEKKVVGEMNLIFKQALV